MGKFSRSWQLGKASWGVLRSSPQLSVLPVLAFLAGGFVALIFALPALASWVAAVPSEGSSEPANAALMVVAGILMLLAYIAASWAAMIFQAALVIATNEIFEGRSTTVGSAIRAAGGHALTLLPWAIVSGTVSFILGSLRNQRGGGLIAGALQVAWSIATLLMLPILLFEHVGLKDAFRRSGSLFKQTWGENLLGNVGIGLVGSLIFLASCLVWVPLIIFGAQANAIPLVVAGVIVAALSLTASGVFTSACTNIFRTALYRYAVQGKDSTGFTHEQIAHAFPATKS